MLRANLRLLLLAAAVIAILVAVAAPGGACVDGSINPCP